MVAQVQNDGETLITGEAEYAAGKAQTKILGEVKQECRRQLALWGVQSHNPVEWTGIEAEEFGEAATESNKAYFGRLNWMERYDDFCRQGVSLVDVTSMKFHDIVEQRADVDRHLDRAREEWVQVAAVAVTIVESIDRQRAAGDL